MTRSAHWARIPALVLLAALVSQGHAAAENAPIASGSADKYQKSTAEQDAAAIEAAKARAQKIEQDRNVHFTTLETPHFLIFTDWDPREHAFLRSSMEGA